LHPKHTPLTHQIKVSKKKAWIQQEDQKVPRSD